jgi:hypothetical protein
MAMGANGAIRMNAAHVKTAQISFEVSELKAV